MEEQRALRFHQKDLHFCSEDEQVKVITSFMFHSGRKKIIQVGIGTTKHKKEISFIFKKTFLFKVQTIRPSSLLYK